ncbi:aminotransferase class I/II-fold pyridoxal phosphate-dependent enzyme [Flavitalea sp. BT771]|uniref:pyridoxal phosphate-dependent aminotransferase n=1 Tax=Flavitalea sp. BT771 TaxID=3063329 RepID=UPI0026E2F929|nr:aminotransferase class I/II-fold pyridoxal phosphate-dependent enzyme [Flavitalea sp. BT771]MDO6433555.1 aminotransferase class I/II-fold pyridoxal phosphate-dependent enzyme [Flavitalea sp. BT771]MDV6222540.1 aminotransferase class I/II-fold pyridoxal phosphate-dependent enzyme [Flavitalea sp. BT771]
MQLSHLAETLIGSEIVKLGGDIREKIRQGEKIYNFTVGDFDPAIFPIPKGLEDGIIDAYRHHFTNYPLAEGNLDLRQSIAAFLKEREGLTYGLDEILVASGGRPLIYALFRTLIDEGDKVVYAVPSWNNNHYTHLNWGEHVVIEAHAENNFMPTAEAIRPHVKDATLICLCSPQNPTGTTISRKDLSAICELVMEENTRRKEGEKKLFLLYDQMYWQLTYGEIRHYDPVSLYPAMRQYTIYIDAISKVFAATGVRVGWSFGPAEIIGKMKAILTHIGAWAPMAEQKATAAFLLEKNKIDEYLQTFRSAVSDRLQRIHAGLQQLKKEGFRVDVLAPEAAIYLTIKMDLAGLHTKNGKTLKEQTDVTSYLLNEAKLAVVPFSAFGASKSSPWYRLSVGTCRVEEIGEMIDKLREAMKQLSSDL